MIFLEDVSSNQPDVSEFRIIIPSWYKLEEFGVAYGVILSVAEVIGPAVNPDIPDWVPTCVRGSLSAIAYASLDRYLHLFYFLYFLSFYF